MSETPRYLTPEDRTQVLNALKRNVNGRQGWDLPPEWGAVYRAQNGRMRCLPFPVPPALWSKAGHPNNLLSEFRNIMARPRGATERAQVDFIRTQVPDSMTAMYLASEGWAPPAHRVAEMWALEERGERRQAYKDLPGRVEVRLAGAVDLDSAMYMVVQPRTTMVLTGAVDDLTAGAELTGAQPELLYALLHLFAPQYA